jgi:hypothetical protein
MKFFARGPFHLFVFLWLGLAGSCTNEQAGQDNLTTDSLETELDFAPPTTAVSVEPFTDFPAPFFLDSLDMSESTVLTDHSGYPSGTEYSLKGYFPQSSLKEHEAFNQAAYNAVSDFLTSYRIGDNDPFAAIEAEIWITGFSQVGEIISVHFTNQSYSNGAAHFNHGYASVNFDLQSDKQVTLTDLVQFKDETEKQKFCDAFNPDPSTEEAAVFLMPEDFSSSRTFTMVHDGITLWFDDFEKGPSWTSLFIPYTKIKGYINPQFMVLFES